MKTRLHLLILILALSARLNAQESPFFFVQISDPQLGFSVGNDDLAPDLALLDTAVFHINNLKPAFVIVSGDMVNSSKNMEQWAAYRQGISKVDKSIPVYHVPGNHDTGKADDEHMKNIDHYRKQMGEDFFSFSYNGCRFIGINSSIIKSENSVLEPQQYKWLEKTLSKSREKNKFVFMHCPVFRKEFDEKEDYSNLSPKDREKYWGLFVKKGVNAVGAGHIHYDRTASYQGIDMNSCGPVTRPLGKGKSGMAVWKVYPKEKRYEYTFYPFNEVPQSINL